MNGGDFHDQLTQRAHRAGVALDPTLAARLEAYYRLLAIWNQKINLTGMDLSRVTPEALDRLLVEPVAAARFARRDAQAMIDIGSGGGSPAIPFALALPTIRLLMIESRSRKSVFLREAARELEMEASVLTARFEELAEHADLRNAHEILTIRAVRIDPKILAGLQAVVKPGGEFFLFRRRTEEQSPELPPGLEMVGTHPLADSLQSELVILRKAQRLLSPLP